MPAFHAPIISAATAAALLFLQSLLMLGVVLQRRSNRQSLGDGGHDSLLKAIRRHGNLAENAGIFVATLALFELLGGNTLQVEILAGVLVLARLSHAFGLSLGKTTNIFRVMGAVLTFVVGIALPVRLALLVWPLLLPLIPH